MNHTTGMPYPPGLNPTTSTPKEVYDYFITNRRGEQDEFGLETDILVLPHMLELSKRTKRVPTAEETSRETRLKQQLVQMCVFYYGPSYDSRYKLMTKILTEGNKIEWSNLTHADKVLMCPHARFSMTPEQKIQFAKNWGLNRCLDIPYVQLKEDPTYQLHMEYSKARSEYISMNKAGEKRNKVKALMENLQAKLNIPKDDLDLFLHIKEEEEAIITYTEDTMTYSKKRIPTGNKTNELNENKDNL